MKVFILPTAMAACTCLTIACSGDNASKPGANPAADASSDASGDVATADASDSNAPDAGAAASFCNATDGYATTAFEACCTSADKSAQEYQFVDGVLRYGTQLCGQQLSASIAKGRITFDASAAQSCASAVQQAIGPKLCWDKILTNRSGRSLFSSPPCSTVVTGLQAQGSACAQDYECKDGLTCVGWTSGSDGACQSPPAVGQPCGAGPTDGGGTFSIDYGFGSHPPCASGAYCAGGTCAAQGASGASCAGDLECQPGLTCHNGQCGTGGPSPQNGACLYKQDCQEGLFCAAQDAGSIGTCQPRETTGGACTQFGDQCKGACAAPDGSAVGQCAAICGSG